MKKRNLFITIFLLIACVFSLTGCKKSNNVNKSNGTPAEQIVASFEKEINASKDLATVANNVNEEIKKITIYDTEVITLNTSDYIEGFTTEIKDYKQAIAIKPFISGQPFIAYIFEVDNPSEFAKTLEDNADLRWNICTEADEVKTAVSDNFVFLVMSKKNFDEEE